MKNNEFGFLKLSMHVLTSRDERGYEKGKLVTLLTQNCEHSDIEPIVAEFMALNPQLSNMHVQWEFTIKDFDTVCYAKDYHTVLCDD
jgi:hypothetical protein